METSLIDLLSAKAASNHCGWGEIQLMSASSPENVVCVKYFEYSLNHP